MAISRTIGSILVLAAVAASAAAPARGQGSDRLSATCATWHDDRARITGCTALLTRGKMSQEDRAIAHVRRGNAYYNLKHYRKAVADYDLALSLNPRSAGRMSRRILEEMCAGKHGARPQAQIAGCTARLSWFRMSAKNRAIRYVLRGNAFYRHKQHRKAVADYDLAVKFDPRSFAAYYNRGVAYYAMGDYASYLENCEHLLRLKPGDGVALNCKAWALFKLNRPAEGLPAAEAALRASPKAASVWNTRAHLHEALGNKAQAIADYRKVLALNPKDAYSKKALKRLGATP